MTLPRPVLIALLGVALCAAAFLATRSANDTGGAVTTTPPVAQPATPANPAAKHAAKQAAGKHASKPQAHKAAPAQHKPVQPTAKPETKPAAPATSAAKPVAPVKPVSPEVAKTLPAIKALGRGDVVVFFFTHAGPADDTGARH